METHGEMPDRRQHAIAAGFRLDQKASIKHRAEVVTLQQLGQLWNVRIMNAERAGIEIGPLAVRKANQKPAPRSQYPPRLGQRRIQILDVIDHLEHQDHVECAILERKPFS